jgi:trehalose synthase-fused probable maltokinase
MQNTRVNLEALLAQVRLSAFLERQRWFGGKARSIASVQLADALELGERGWLTVITVAFDSGAPQQYLLPLALVDRSAAAASRPEAVLASLDTDRVLADGVYDDAMCIAVLDIIQGTRQFVSPGGVWKPERIRQDDVVSVHQIRRTAPDQSNTSILFGDAAILKLFRRVEFGPNPDVEIGGFLTRAGFPHVPRTLGTLEYVRQGDAPAAIAMLQQFVPNRGNGWEVMLDVLGSVDTDGKSPSTADALPVLLGRRTGELHVHLAMGEGESLAPEPFQGAALARAAEEMRTRAEAHLDVLVASVNQLDQETRTSATQVLDMRRTLVHVFTTMAALEDGGQRIRCHGDYHLGQTLITDDNVVILDFEGEPARPRRTPREEFAAPRCGRHAQVLQLCSHRRCAFARRRRRPGWRIVSGVGSERRAAVFECLPGDRRRRRNPPGEAARGERPAACVRDG